MFRRPFVVARVLFLKSLLSLPVAHPLRRPTALHV